MIDYPYIIFYLILLFLSYQYRKTGKESIAKWSLALAFIFFVFRAPVVGADTWNYVRYLTGERNFYNNDTRDLEVGFVVYREIISNITSSRFLVMLITYTLAFYPLYLCVKRFSLNIPLSILMFCYMGCLSVYFVGMRQILGVALLVAALYYCMKEENTLKYKMLFSAGAIVLAYFFHTTCVLYALIFVISFFIPVKSRKIYLGLVIGSALLGFILETLDIQSLFSLYLAFDIGVTERLENYLMNDELNDAGAFNIIMRQSLIALVTFLFLDEKKINHPFCKIYVSGIIIYNLLYTVPMVHRIIPPLTMFGAVCFSWILDSDRYVSVAKYRKVVNIACVFVLLYFTRSMLINISNCDLSSEERMHPYYFFFQYYMDHPSVTKF